MRTLSVWDLITYGMLYMLPIAPFSMYGILSDATHGMVPLAYLLAVVAMIFTARSYSIFSTAYPVAGSVYSYTRMGISDLAGFFGGWLVFLDYILAPGLLAVVSGAAMNHFIPGVARWEWIVLFLGIGGSMNFIGLDFTARANRVMLLICLAVLAIFLLVGLHALYSGKGNGGLTFHALYNPKAFAFGSMGTGVLMACVNFLGFDAITTLGEEVKQDQKHLMGFAAMFTLGSIAVMFVLQSWVAADLSPGAATKTADTAFYDIAQYAGGSSLSALTAIATAVAFGVPCTIVCQSAITRIIYAMARDGQLPSLFAKVHARSKQPYAANLLVSSVSLGIALFFQSSLDNLVLFQNFGALTAFIMINLSVVGYFFIRLKSGKVVQHVIMPLIGVLISISLIFAMRRATLQLGCCWLAIGVVYYIVMRFGLRRKLALNM